MSRIEQTFKGLNRAALVSFIMAGDPGHAESLKLLKSLPAAGADIIELGMPFTDPVADGLTIQKAGERALAAGASMARTLEMVRDFRRENDKTPIVLMGYANPVFIYGYQRFAKDAAEAGVDGMIIVDLPPEESAALQTALAGNGIDLIRLLTPTTDEARLGKLLNGASGFLYYVSIAGITGTGHAKAAAIKPHIEMIKSKTALPVCIGFGIKTPADAAEMAGIADGVVVGSAIIEAQLAGGAAKAAETVKKLSASLAAAV